MSVSKTAFSFSICSALVGAAYFLNKKFEHNEKNSAPRRKDKNNINPSNNHTFSIVKEDTEYVWIVPNIWKFVDGKKTTQWVVPDGFLDQWTWGDTQPADHIERILNADLKYPVIIYKDKIIDGTHRTIKSLALGKKSVNAVVLNEMPPYDFSSPIPPLTSLENVSDRQSTFRDMVRIAKETMGLK